MSAQPLLRVTGLRKFFPVRGGLLPAIGGPAPPARALPPPPPSADDAGQQLQQKEGEE